MPKSPFPAAGVVRERKEEQDARNELFAGREEIKIDTTQIPLENQTEDQLVDTAVRTHKDTTAVAQRALKVVQESKQIQAETMRQLSEQSKTMYGISTKMDEVNEELTYAEKLLSYMRRCCCCWLCDSCTGADPEEQRKRNWQQRVAKGETQVAGGTGSGTAAASNGATGGSGPFRRVNKASGAAGTAPPGARQGDPDIRLPEEHRAAEMRLQEETRRQNDMIDQIHSGLETLLEGAKVMTDELAVQNQHLDALNAKATATKDRLEDVNKNSQLRNFGRGKAKTKKEEDEMFPLPTKAGAAAEAAKRLAGL